MRNVRRTLAIKIQTPGGDNPLLLDLVSQLPYFRGVPVSGLALVARGGTPPYAYTILSGGDSSGQINGLTLHTDGTITGTPTAAGHFVFVAQVQDSDGSVFPHGFAIDFKSQLIVVRGAPTPGEDALPYSYQFIVRDLTGTTITSGYSVVSGNLPAGLSLSSSGLLAGTPTFAAVGFSYATVNVNTGTDSIDIDIAVQIYSILLAFSIDFDLTLYATQTYSGVSPTTFPTGGARPYRYRWDNLADYTWLSFDYNLGTFSGVPPFADIGVDQIISGTVTDALGATVPVEFKFRPVYAIASVNGVMPDTNDGAIVIPVGSGGVQTVNGIGPDSSGAVVIPVGSVDSVNGVGPDSSGDVQVQTDRVMAFGLDGGGIDLTAGMKSRAVRANGNWKIVLSTIFLNPGSASADCVLLVKTSTYANYDTGSSIVASAKPTLSTAIKNQDSSLSGWTIDVVDGNFYWIEIESVSGTTNISLNLSIMEQL